jgi:hypothetical protein
MIQRYRNDGGDMGRKPCHNNTFPNLRIFLNRTYYQQQKDILLVAEDLDRQTIDMDRLRSTLKPYTDIRIVVTYRRLHDWYKSWYNEIVKMYLRSYLSERLGGLPITFPSFVSWMENRTMMNKAHTEALEQRYRNQNMSVQILHYHRKESLLENLFCTTLDLPMTCEAIRNGTLSGEVFRESRKDLELCRWIIMANGNNETLRRPQQCYDKVARVQAKMDKHNITEQDFPLLRVPQSTLDLLWNQTVQAEAKYFSHLGIQKKEPTDRFLKETRGEFDRVIENKWYSINVEEMDRTKKFDFLLS